MLNSFEIFLNLTWIYNSNKNTSKELSQLKNLYWKDRVYFKFLNGLKVRLDPWFDFLAFICKYLNNLLNEDLQSILVKLNIIFIRYLYDRYLDYIKTFVCSHDFLFVSLAESPAWTSSTLHRYGYWCWFSWAVPVWRFGAVRVSNSFLYL